MQTENEASAIVSKEEIDFSLINTSEYLHALVSQGHYLHLKQIISLQVVAGISSSLKKPLGNANTNSISSSSYLFTQTRLLMQILDKTIEDVVNVSLVEIIYLLENEQ